MVLFTLKYSGCTALFVAAFHNKIALLEVSSLSNNNVLQQSNSVYISTFLLVFYILTELP